MKFWSRRNELDSKITIAMDIGMDEWCAMGTIQRQRDFVFNTVLRGLVDKFVADHGDEILNKIDIEDMAKEIPKQVGLALAAKIMETVKRA